MVLLSVLLLGRFARIDIVGAIIMPPLLGLLGLLVLWRRGGCRDGLRQPWRSALLASAALFGYHALYFFALKRAPVVEANLINYLWPLLIVLFAALLPGARIGHGQWLGTLLGLAGAALVVTRGEGLSLQAAHWPGYLAAFAAALIWAAYSVLNRRFAQEIPEGIVVAFGPPAIPGLGTGAGFTFMLQDQSGNTPADLAAETERFIPEAGS